MITAYPVLSDAEQAFADGRIEEAAQLALRHARAHPTELRGIVFLGTVAMRMGAILPAEKFFRQALAQDPGNPEIRRKLASAVHQQERLPEALDMFSEIVDAEPVESPIRAVIASILDKLGRPDDARAMLEWLIEHQPGNPSNWINYGHNLRAAARTDEAVMAYRKAIAIDAERGDAWWGIANIKKRVLDDDDIAAMRAALTLAIDNTNLAPLHFSMARAMNDRKRYEEAFHHYSEANRLWAETLQYVASELTEEVDQSKSLFGADFFADQGGGAMSDSPIFIVSLPRAGSTLLEQMLDSHPQIEGLGELPYIPSLLRSMIETATRRAQCSVPEATDRLTPAERTAFGEEYLRRAAVHRKSDAPYFVDKMPHNWSNIAFIRRILPNARFLDIRRGAMSCCFSNFTHSFSRAHASSFALKDIGRSYVDYVRLMAHFDQAAPGMVHHVQYETLVQEPEPELRRAMEYLRLPWDPAVLSFHESSRTVRTPSAEQVRRPLNREGMENWQPYSQWLGPLRDALGELADG
jgi:tetratricopeptide (TPR) repeat protein